MCLKVRQVLLTYFRPPCTRCHRGVCVYIRQSARSGPGRLGGFTMAGHLDAGKSATRHSIQGKIEANRARTQEMQLVSTSRSPTDEHSVERSFWERFPAFSDR